MLNTFDILYETTYTNKP